MPLLRQKQYRFVEPALPATKTFVDYSGGLNTRDSEFDVKDNELTKAQDTRYTAQGGFKKRSGTLRKGSAKIGSTTKVLGLHSYVNKTNTSYLLAGAGTDIYKYTELGSPVVIATSTSSQATGYSKDRHMVFTTTLDANSNPYLVAFYQSGAGLKLEWSDTVTGTTPYDTWTHTVISVDASTQLGFFAVIDSSDNIHLAYMSGANTIKYIKMTYAAGPTWTASTPVTIAGTGAADSATNPCIYRVASTGLLVVGYRYYNGTNYQIRGITSADSGLTWTGDTGLSTASTNANHGATLANITDIPVLVYQVTDATNTKFFYRVYSGSTWTSQTQLGSTTTSTLNAFTAVITGSSLSVSYATSAGSSGLVQAAFGTAESTTRRKFAVRTDGATDHDITYTNFIDGAEDSTSTNVTNDANNNLYPSTPEYVSSTASFVPVMWTEGTAVSWNVTINSSSNWSALGAALTTNLRQCSAYFPSSGAGGTDQIYITNGTDVMKKWDGTTLTSANAAYPKEPWLCFFGNRLWMGGTNNRVYYTPIGADGFAGAIAGGNTIDFPEQTLWGHWYKDQTIFIFTRYGVYNISNFDYSGVNAGPEIIRKIPNSYGTLSGYTVKQIGYWVYYQRPDGHIMRTNGQYAELVSDKIRGSINDLTKSLLGDASAGTLNDYYYLAVAGNAAGQTNQWLVLNTKTYDQNQGGWSIDTGKTTSCFVTHPDTNSVPQLFYGDSTTSTSSVFQAEIGNSDNGSAITMNVQTGVKILGSATFRKLLKKIYTYAEASGSYSLTVGYARFQSLTQFSQYPVSLDPLSGTWGVSVWDPSSIWGGNSHIEDITEVNVRDRLFKFQFYQSGVNQPVSVLGFATTYQTIKDEI